MNKRSFCLLMVWMAMVVGAFTCVKAETVLLSNEHWQIKIAPETLHLTAEPKDKYPVVLSKGFDTAETVTRLSRKDNRLSFCLAGKNVTAELKLDERELSVQFRADSDGEFSLPIFREAENVKALILPRAEGIYLPLDNERWKDYLVEQESWNTLEQLSMPFLGWECEGYILTWIVTNPYNNTIAFSRENNILEAKYTHEFTRFENKKECGFLIRLSDSRSPVEPARQFRKWLTGQGRFVSMQEKMKKIPRVERLQGAAHAYLWGDDLLSRHDISRKNWPLFCKRIVEQANSSQPNPGKRIKQLLKPEQYKEITELATAEWPSNYLKTQVATALSGLLGRTDFSDTFSGMNNSLPAEVQLLSQKTTGELPIDQLCRLNSHLLYAAYSEFLNPVETWGNGVSTKMLKRLQDHGFDRMRLCVGGWEGVEKRPGVAVLADKMGYLFGTYDSFHSIHDPKLKGTDATWTTAQFDAELFRNGVIMKKDGSFYRGFKQKGGKLSPLAARSHVEKRVGENMNRVPYSYYFVDCDAYGEMYNDYSPLHLAGQADDAAARIDRLRWIGATFGVPIGSEGGCHLFTGVIHVSEGIFGKFFGWDDPDMKDSESKYYKGGYYPPDGPKVFVMQVPLKPEYEYFYFDPRFRLPLYETVFHDSVVATHWWGYGSLKFTTVTETVELTELLYMVPPMYNLNLDEFDKHRETMKRHYAFFSPLHRRVGFAPMTDFAWLSDDRLLQRTVFGDRIEMIANFSTETKSYKNHTIPPRSIMANDIHENKTEIFTPLAK